MIKLEHSPYLWRCFQIPPNQNPLCEHQAPCSRIRNHLLEPERPCPIPADHATRSAQNPTQAQTPPTPAFSHRRRGAQPAGRGTASGAEGRRATCISLEGVEKKNEFFLAAIGHAEFREYSVPLGFWHCIISPLSPAR